MADRCCDVMATYNHTQYTDDKTLLYLVTVVKLLPPPQQCLCVGSYLLRRMSADFTQAVAIQTGSKQWSMR